MAKRNYFEELPDDPEELMTVLRGMSAEIGDCSRTLNELRERLHYAIAKLDNYFLAERLGRDAAAGK